jgi:hypothetical protein
MNFLTKTLQALRVALSTDAFPAHAEEPLQAAADPADLQTRMAAQARNSMGLMSISGR